MSWFAEIHPHDNNVIRIREVGGETIICEIPIPCEAEREMKWKWAVKMAAAPRMLSALKALAAIGFPERDVSTDDRIAAWYECKHAIEAATETTSSAGCGESKGKSI